MLITWRIKAVFQKKKIQPSSLLPITITARLPSLLKVHQDFQILQKIDLGVISAVVFVLTNECIFQTVARVAEPLQASVEDEWLPT